MRAFQIFKGLASGVVFWLGMAIATPAHAAEYEASCTFDEWMISPTRVHLRCHEAPAAPTGVVPPGVRYFAVDPRRQQWFAQMAIEACHNWILRVTVTHPTSWCILRFRFDQDALQNPEGCLAKDCRKLTAVMAYN